MRVELEGVSKIYKRKRVVSNVSLSLREGDRVAVLGSNGAGKTTLLEMLATVQEWEQGTILYDGSSFRKNKKEIRKKVGYVPQEVTLFPKLTVSEQLSFWAKMSPVSVTKETIEQLLELVGLKGQRDQRIEHLSGGMKRKVNIILSLLHDPELIILDEPTVGIDVQSMLEIIQFMKEICSAGKTLIFSSHNIQEIRELCNKVAYLYEGELLFFGTLQEAVQLVKKKELEETKGWQAFSFLFRHFK